MSDQPVLDQLLERIPVLPRTLILGIVGLEGVERLRAELQTLGQALANHDDQTVCDQVRLILTDMGVTLPHEDQHQAG